MLNYEGRKYNLAEFTEEQQRLFQAFLKISAMRERAEDNLNKAQSDFEACNDAHMLAKGAFESMLSSVPSEEIVEEESDD